MSEILLRFSRGSGTAAWVVRCFTWSWCAHVGFKIVGDDRVLDATPERGVAYRVAKDDRSTRYFRVDLSADIVADAHAWAARHIGLSYDWGGALGIGFHQDWHHPRSWFCSELVAASFEQAGLPLLRADWIDRITPRDLLLSPYLIPLKAKPGSPADVKSAGGGKDASTSLAARRAPA